MLESSNQFQGKIQFGEQLLQNGKINEALEIFDDVLDKEPDNTIALNDKGVALNTLGKHHDAIQNFLKAIRIDDSNSNTIFNLISNYFAIGKWREAENTLFKYEYLLSKQDVNMIKTDLKKAKHTILDSDSIKALTLSINQNSISGNLKFYLDINKHAQKIMWEYLVKNELYESETLQCLTSMLKDGDCFIDIGAHIGYFSLLASLMVGNEGQVFSFEPEDSNYLHLNTHISENNLSNIQAINAALGAESKEAQFFINLDADGGHALWNVGLLDSNEKSRANPTVRNINVFSLDDVFKDRELNSLKLIKIDAEGADYDILRGGINTILKYDFPYIICEINRFDLQQMGTNEEAFRHFMKELGYDTYLLNDSGSNIVKLLPEHHVESDYIFNLLFANEEKLRKDGFLKCLDTI
jgi:FkbM family methyltransferase